MSLPDRMRPFSLRRLTAGERSLAADVFGRALDPGRVRIWAIPIWPRAFVPSGRLIVWPGRGALADFSEAPAPQQAVFVHELAHAWQGQRGRFLPLAKIKAGDRPSSYAYDLEDGPPFSELNIEQQAMVIQHAFLAARGHPTPHAADVYARALAAMRES